MMNLHVNLILESELRSSSRVSRKFVIRTASAILIIILMATVVFVLLGAHSAKKELLFAEQESKQLDPVFRTVNDLKQELSVIRDLTNAVATWSQTRVDFPVLFVGIQSVVPANIQLTRLTLNENIALVEGAPSISVTIYLQGKAGGEHAETDVQELEKKLKQEPPFNGIMDLAQVKQFDAAKSVGQANMRVFDMECRLKTIRLFQPVKVNPVKTK